MGNFRPLISGVLAPGLTENYNANGKQRYYQGFVCNLKDEKGRNNDGDC